MSTKAWVMAASAVAVVGGSVALGLGWTGEGDLPERPAESESLSGEHTLHERVPQVGVTSGVPGETDSTVTDCATLIDEGWTADPARVDDFAYDPESGLVTIHDGTRQSVTVDLVRDPRCFELPGVGRQLEQIVADAESFVDE